jgi:hypothetical protein
MLRLRFSRFALTSVLVASVGCNAVAGGDFFPQYSDDRPFEVPAGEIQGTVVIEDGCILLDAGSSPHLLIWPESFALDDSLGTLAVRDDRGNVVAESGMSVHYGGGEYKSEHRAFVEELIGMPVPASCAGERYWLVSRSL